MESRGGYPNEHLAKGMGDEVKSPIYATGIGLVMKGLNDAILTENLIKEDDSEVTEVKIKDKKRSFGFNIDIFKKWLTDDDLEDFKKIK